MAFFMIMESVGLISKLHNKTKCASILHNIKDMFILHILYAFLQYESLPYAKSWLLFPFEWSIAFDIGVGNILLHNPIIYLELSIKKRFFSNIQGNERMNESNNEGFGKNNINKSRNPLLCNHSDRFIQREGYLVIIYA